MPDWESRQKDRQIRLAELEEEHDYVHDELVKLWLTGQRGPKLLDRNLELQEKIKEARRGLKVSLQARPSRR